MAMEGMHLTSKDKDRIRFCVGDNWKVKSVIHELAEEYHKDMPVKDILNIRK